MPKRRRAATVKHPLLLLRKVGSADIAAARMEVATQATHRQSIFCATQSLLARSKFPEGECLSTTPAPYCRGQSSFHSAESASASPEYCALTDEAQRQSAPR